MATYYSEDQLREAFLQRAGFRYGWENLESAARRMVEQALREQEGLTAFDADDVQGMIERMRTIPGGHGDIVHLLDGIHAFLTSRASY